MHRDALKELLAGLARSHGVPGAQLAVHRDGRTTAVSHGLLTAGTGPEAGADADADAAADAAATAGAGAVAGAGVVGDDAAFPLGSLTKPFTAALAMRLVAAGDAGLDSPLTRHLPELAGTAADRLTLRQVLSHRSGLPSAVDEATVTTADRRRWALRNCRVADLAHPPGTVFSYSNVGYVLVGLLAELVTGMDWRTAVGDVLLRPMGIVPAFATGTDSPSRPMAAGHTVDPSAGPMAAGPTVDPSARLTAAGHTAPGGTPRVRVLRGQSLSGLEDPDGALAASATDLVTFVTALRAEPEAFEEMLRDQLMDAEVGSFGMADGWGLGWAIHRDTGKTWYGHDGNADGTSCHLRFEPESGTVVALTTNASTGPALWEALVTGLGDLGLDVGGRSFASSADRLEPRPPPVDCAGRYRNGASEVVVALRDGRLELSADGPPPFALTCYAGSRFTMENAAHRGMRYAGRFVRDPHTGETAFVQVAGRTARRHDEVVR